MVSRGLCMLNRGFLCVKAKVCLCYLERDRSAYTLQKTSVSKKRISLNWSQTWVSFCLRSVDLNIADVIGVNRSRKPKFMEIAMFTPNTWEIDEATAGRGCSQEIPGTTRAHWVPWEIYSSSHLTCFHVLPHIYNSKWRNHNKQAHLCTGKAMSTNSALNKAMFWNVVPEGREQQEDKSI